MDRSEIRLVRGRIVVPTGLSVIMNMKAIHTNEVAPGMGNIPPIGNIMNMYEL